MSLNLVSIRFRGVLSNDLTIPLRKNSDTLPPAGPEWQAAAGGPVTSVPVAYRLDATKNRQIGIEVTFDSTGGEFDVRADAASSENVLRTVRPFHVSSPGPGRVTMQATVDAPALTDPAQQRIRRHTDRLAWRATDNAGQEVMSTVTEHSVYSIFAEPKAPWGTSDSATGAWTDALDIACDWAGAAQTVDDATSAITRRLFGLGRSPSDQPFRYSSGASYILSMGFGGTLFGCIDFIETLSGVQPLGPRTLNCTDTASLVSTFSNVLGGELAQGKVFPARIKPVQFIGQTDLRGENFTFHEIVWTGDGKRVWDACVALDTDADAATEPVLATGITYNDGTPASYAHILEDNGDGSELSKPPNDLKLEVNRKLTRIRRREEVELPGFMASAGAALPGKLRSWELMSDKGVEGYSISYHLPGPDDRIWFEITTRKAPAEGVKPLLEAIRKTYATSVQEVKDLGDGAFATSNSQEFVFGVGQYVVQIRNTSSIPMKVDRKIVAVVINALRRAKL
jgi:hypothetical protein